MNMVQAFRCEHWERKVYLGRSSARSHELGSVWNTSRLACASCSNQDCDGYSEMRPRQSAEGRNTTTGLSGLEAGNGRGDGYGMTGVSGRGAGAERGGDKAYQSLFSAPCQDTKKTSSGGGNHRTRQGKNIDDEGEITSKRQEMQSIRQDIEGLIVLTRLANTPRTEEELAILSRRSFIRQLGGALNTLYGCLEASSRLEVRWLEKVLQVDPLPLVDSLNTIGSSWEFQIVRRGEWLSLEVANG